MVTARVVPASRDWPRSRGVTVPRSTLRYLVLIALLFGCQATTTSRLALRVYDPHGRVEAPLGVPGVRARSWEVGETALDCALATPPDNAVSAIELRLTLDGESLRVDLAETRSSRDEAVRRCLEASLGSLVIEAPPDEPRLPVPLRVELGPR